MYVLAMSPTNALRSCTDLFANVLQRSLTRINCCSPAQLPYSGVSGISEDYENESYIWGTTIRARQVSSELEQFFSNFTEEGAAEAKYLNLLREVSCHQALLSPALCAAVKE